ncbi:bZIP transcription factor 17-like [Bidens hawaiensis]|uniref:bZIP transcription factor 17-like n=1 Tax=Bidens hawaiensis TaxID=980011 RepID=UPI00404B3709
MSTDDPAATAAVDPLSHLLIPPLTFSDDFQFLDDEGFDITFDDFTLPEDTQQFLNSSLNASGFLDLSSSDPEFNGFVSDREIDGNNYGSDICGYLNIPSPDDDNEEMMMSNNNINNKSVKSVKSSVRVLDNSSPESRHPLSSQGSAGSEADMSCPSPESGNSVVNQKVKCEMMSNNNNSIINKNDDDDNSNRNDDKNKNNVVLKRKNENYDVNSNSKYRRSNETSTLTDDESNPIDEKKRARLIRNRESAQLSRQRKKHYVEELEDKVRAMHATIQDLNARISYFAAENANLKQQMVTGGGVGVGGGGVCSGPVMYPPHPVMPVGYPWMPCPPYVVKSQGSQVPLVPIPRLKPQQPALSQKSKKTEVKKPVEGVAKSKTKTKKVAGISFIGLLLFIMLFGGLVPLMNVKLSGVVTNGVYLGNKSSDYKVYNHGRVLMSDEYDHLNRTKSTNGNASEPLVASLYVPRNDKLVKIDGNLIIHSVLASEKAMASREEQDERIDDKDDDGVTGSSDLVPAISIPAVNRNVYRTSSGHQRALSSDKEKSKSKHADGKLQQWFREGLAGPMLSSGMCTEVFQFDVSAAIVPATSAVNITASDNHHNSTYTPTMKNRRILHGLPIPLSATTTNITKEKVAAAAEPGGHDSDHHEPHYKNNSASSMVVSVLFDPREAGDGADVEGMMGAKGKSFSRIFVVVLLDSVKYVTYSCMLPLKGASHLVTA